ncbi:MAG: hypothetical protein ACM33T_01875 [Solirubrobacterales bacterium]
MDQATSKKLFDYIYQSLDDENAADLETFARNFSNNSEVWDVIADHFPDAKPSEVRQILMQAFAAWQQGRS